MSMKYQLKYLLSIALIGMVWHAHAQFPKEVQPYLGEVTKRFSDAGKKEGKEFVELRFAPVWTGGYLSEDIRQRVYTISDGMLKKRLSTYPDFENFYLALIGFQRSGKSMEELGAYLDGVDYALKKGRKKNIVLVLESGANLLERNAIYASASTVWRNRGGTLTFAFDTVPKVYFEDMDLVCEAKGDSAVIRGTKGTYLPISSQWYGTGGMVDWARAGLRPTATFAQWTSDYEIKLKSASFTVDSVEFNDPYFDVGLLGKLDDKVLANVTADKASYPRFESYDRRKKIKDIEPGVDFEGGFSMKGAALQGYGTNEEPATLVFHREGRPFIITRSLYYVIEPTRISSNDVSTVIYLDKDSVIHPSTSLKLIRDKKQLSLIKKDEGVSKGPFVNTYHNLDMYFEAMYWKLGDPVLEIGNLFGSSQTKASFESYNYFKDRRYQALMGMDHVHPLARLNDKFKESGEYFTAQEFAVSTRLQKQQVIPMLMDLANKGYIDYNVDTELIRVKPRLREHILANARKQDYDVLQFNSNMENGKNAIINLLNNDLAISGIARIVLSDSQDVKIYPDEGKVLVKKNRDFQFGGVVKAGKLQFYGKEYFFHYEPFVVDLLNVDSVSFYADSFEADEDGFRSLVRVKNVIENISGTLEIDEPSNKSGLWQKDYPAYPRFNNVQESFVYYDRKSIQQGVYDRDRFYFRTDPFSIDSLDNFTNKGINFPGTLVSAGIFADIVEPLKLQPDYSLGFVRGTGDAGMALYQKGSTFTDKITLNSDGLQGAGVLDFLTTTASSEQFVFCPDSTFGVADTLINVGASTPSKVPQVNAGDVFTKFEPDKDVFTASIRKKPMVMFDNEALLYGGTQLTPSGMTGAGLVDFRNATLSSDLFSFETRKVKADTSDFRLTEGDTSAIAFSTDNVNATIDLDERVGDFVSNGDETIVEFPVNKYICYMDRFKWFMDDGAIQLESDRQEAAASKDLQLSGPNFISVHPDQDSLSFMAPKARYDLKKHVITALDVEYIPVADALIYPDSATIRIRRNAKMDNLTNSAIVANFVTKYHNVYNADVVIKAKRHYEGSGDLDYVDETKRAQTLHLQEISVDSAFQTYGYGKIDETDAFQLSPHFDYFGKFELFSREKQLTFTGSVRILHECNELERNWMNFSASIDPNEIYIPVGDTLKNDIGREIGAGVRLTDEDPYSMYGTFLSEIKQKEDRPLVTSSGLLYFDKAKQQYQISNKEKLKQRNLPGNFISLDVKTCRFEGDGRIASGLDLGQVKLDNIGTLLHLPDEGKTSTNLVMKTDFFFHDNALERMASEILAYPDQKPMKIGETQYDKFLKEQLGLEKSDKLISELSIKGGLKKLPDEVRGSIVFGDISFEWDELEEAFVSKGAFSIATILKKPVYRELKGKVVLQRKRTGDEMTMFIMINENMYYYFSYARNTMSVYSSDEEFNNSLADLKEDRFVYDHKKGEAPYRFTLVSKAKVNRFRDEYDL